MNKDEIKKALEICSKDEDCEKCPYCDHYRCDRALQKDSFVLITEQEQEIERLKDDYAKLQEQFADYQMASDKEIVAQAKQAKIDVLNELKTHSYFDDYYIDSYVFVDDIDELIEEVENETKKETSRSTL